MGLLSKVIDKGKEINPSPVFNNTGKTREEKNYLVNRAEKYSGHVYSFYSIFRDIESDFEKCVLFLSVCSGSEIFYPFASKGFDKTTENRMRLDIRQIKADIFNRPGSISKDEIEVLRPFFSTREFDMIDTVYFHPFSRGDRVFAAFMVINPENSKIERINSRLHNLSDHYDERYSMIPCGNYVFNRSDKFRSDLAKLLMDKGSPFQMFDLDFSDYFDMLEKEYSFIRRTFIRHDVMQILCNLFESSGTVYSNSGNNVIIIFQSKTVSSAQLILHQIILSVRNILPWFDEKSIEAENYKFPEQAEILSECYQ